MHIILCDSEWPFVFILQVDKGVIKKIAENKIDPDSKSIIKHCCKYNNDSKTFCTKQCKYKIYYSILYNLKPFI